MAISSILSALPTLAGLYTGYGAMKKAGKAVNAPPQEAQIEQLVQQQLPLINQYMDYSRMMVNPNDPTYQALVRQEEGDIRGRFAQALNQAVTENRRQQGLGRTPLFDAERGGEVRFRAMMQQQNDARTQAQQQALQRLGLAADSTRNAMSMYQQPISALSALGQSNLTRELQNRGLGVQAQQGMANMLTSSSVQSIADRLAGVSPRTEAQTLADALSNMFSRSSRGGYF